MTNSHNLQKINVTIFIHTLNEQVNLPHALRSVIPHFSEVIVIDAGSSDGTQEIAMASGAKLVQITGDRSTLVKQRNWALENIKPINEWVFILDADESIPSDLRNEISTVIHEKNDNIDGYWVRYKEVILGRTLTRATLYPNWNMRLLRASKARYENRTVNAHVNIPHQRTSKLFCHFIHDDKRGFKAYVKRMASITVVEALSLDEMYNSKDENLMQGSLFSKSFISRRRALKKIFYKLPFRPLIIFFYLYFIRMGFLEGKPGLNHCIYKACTEAMVNILRWEAKNLDHE